MLSPHDRAIVHSDAALPGLATVLDPAAITTVLRLSKHPARLGTAHITYVKYKPGVSCLVGYHCDAPVTPVQAYAKARWPPVLGRSPTPHGPARGFLANQGVVISCFPHDRKLPALSYLADPATRQGLLRELFPGRPALWGGTLHGLTYRPEHRYVAEVRIDSNTLAVVKVYTAPWYDAASHRAAAFTSHGPLQLARYLGHSDQHCIMALEWLPGRRLGDVIATSSLAYEAAAGAGMALAALHAQNPHGLPCWTREAEVATLRGVAAVTGRVCPHLAGHADGLARRLATHLLHGPAMNCPIHGDFNITQVLLITQGAGILDLDKAARGDPLTDLGSFIANLEHEALRGALTPSRADRLRDAFLRGYGVAMRRLDPAHINLFVCAGLLRRALYPFRVHEATWPQETAALLQRAETILNTVTRL